MTNVALLCAMALTTCYRTDGLHWVRWEGLRPPRPPYSIVILPIPSPHGPSLPPAVRVEISIFYYPMPAKEGMPVEECR